jgi:collagenase-like PrtC family protease
MYQDLELLAPAGDWAALAAALDAGADAIYFGLRTLNARRRAKNFSPDEFVKAVEAIHARGAKAYLTLNIDLVQRELGQAARTLELARQSHADAVLVRDPALLALRSAYPELEFHFSTQTCMTNSADVTAAGKLGAERVVLAREMTLAEIAAASAVPGVKTEVFVQGALCFSISGRCLLSSWAGGRSGNRGTCTSPCRVPWNLPAEKGDCPDFRGHHACMVGENGTVPFFDTNTPLSMKDLSLINRLPELGRAGVTALKIEGRLKNAAWVGRAVSLYKRALTAEKKGTGSEPINTGSNKSGASEVPVPFFSSEEGKILLQEAANLGAYTGRSLTSAYLDGQRDDLTGRAEGRKSSTELFEGVAKSSPLPLGEGKGEGSDVYSADESTYDLRLTIEPKGIACSCVCGRRTDEWTMPKTVIRRAHKAIAIGVLFDQLAEGTLQGFQLGRRETNDAEFLLTPRAANALVERISSTIRLSQKMPNEMVRIDLPPVVNNLLAQKKGTQLFFSANHLCLGNKPDRVRIGAKAAAAFLQRVRPKGVIVEGLTINTLPRIRAICENVSLVVALPQVFFEDQIPHINGLLRQCSDEGVTVEVNSWGGWHLAKEANATMEAGPGLPVLNSLAAQLLAEKGMKCVTLSPEADRRQLEDLTAQCAVPCSLVVFGRPPLITTRVEVPEQLLGQVLTDRREVQIIPRREQGLCVFRPVEPFDLRGLTNEQIRVKHLVVDLIGSDDPLSDWQNLPLPEDESFHFNYDRTLA